MAKFMLCTAVVLVGCTAVRADTFNFSYSSTGLGGPVNASGTLTAAQFMPGGFEVTSITGDRNGDTIVPPGGGGVFYWGPNVSGSIYFTLGLSGLLDSVTFNNGGYIELGTGGLYSAGNFSIGRSMPEPATLAIFLTMGLGALVLARKMPSNRRV
jgi:hypothetical protein